MPEQPSVSPVAVKRVIYKEILEGDRRKFVAQSNDAPSGGGARDLRFSPYSRFESAFKAIFPEATHETRKRGGIDTTVPILKGEFFWMEDGEIKHTESYFEPPDDPRPTEGRIPRVNTYGCFRSVPADGRIFLLLVQQMDDTVWPAFATESSLRAGEWNSELTREILDCINATRNAGVAVAGYVDFTTGSHFCNERAT